MPYPSRRTATACDRHAAATYHPKLRERACDDPIGMRCRLLLHPESSSQPQKPPVTWSSSVGVSSRISVVSCAFMFSLLRIVERTLPPSTRRLLCGSGCCHGEEAHTWSVMPITVCRISPSACAPNARQCSVRFRQLRTSRRTRLGQRCAQLRTHAAQQTASLLDHLVGTGEQRRRYLDSERLRSLEIEHQLVFGRCLHWQVGGLLAL